MNCIYSTVWSEARGTYVVAHEKSKAKGKPSSARKAAAQAVTAALLALGAGQAMAATNCTAAGPITIDGAMTSTCTLAADNSLTVTGGGSISVSGSSTAGYGVFINGGVAAGSITNSGTITGPVAGIYVAGEDNQTRIGNISNEGTILSPYGNGIDINYVGTVTGNISNSGIINSASFSAGITVRTSSSVDGFISNSGTITSRYGIEIDDSSKVSGIYNSKVISSLYSGIYVGQTSIIDGAISNSGVISSGSAGIVIETATVNDSISNSGSIIVAGESAYAGIGIVNTSSVVGNITNSGLISVAHQSTYTGTSSSGRAVYGIEIQNSTTAAIVNSGTINVSIAYDVPTGYFPARAAAIGIGAELSHTEGITNSGTITASATASASGTSAEGISATAYAYGIAVNAATVTGNIFNSGTITTHASASATNAGGGSASNEEAVGIFANNSSITGSITNSGTISSLDLNSIGINIRYSTINEGIFNSGIITSGASGRGISIDASSIVTGGITNSVKISGREAIYIGSGSSVSGGIHNLAGGQIIGTSSSISISQANRVDITNDGTLTGAVNGNANLSNSGLYILPESTSTANNASVTGAYGSSSITGNYTQGADGTLRIGASGTATGQYSTLTVGGTATLPALTHIDVNVKGFNLFGTGGGTLAGVINAGTLSASTFNVTDNSVLVNFVGVKNGNAVDLNVVAQGSAPTEPTPTPEPTPTRSTAILASVQSTGNTPATGAAIELGRLLGLSLANGTSGNTGMDAVLTNLVANHSGTDQQVSDAVSQTLPLMTGGQSAAISGAQHSVNRIVQARQDGQQGRSSGDEFLGDKQVWVKPFGSVADQNDSNGVTGFKAKTSGIVFGVDSEVQNINRLGGALAIAHTSVDGNSSVAPQSSTVDSYQLVVYGSRSLSDATDINFQADIGTHANKGLRNVTFMGSTAKSDYSSLSAHLGAGLAHTLSLNEKSTFTPSVRADYTRVNDDGYTETGAGALNLAVGSSSTEEFILSAGAKLTHKLQERTLLTGSLGAGYDLINQQASITSAYAGAPSASFTTNGLKPSPWLLRAGVGVVHTTVKGLELTARYDVEGRESFINQTVSAKLRWAF